MSHFIDGDKIYLRPFMKSDIPVWFAWFNDPLVTEHMNKGIFPNTELLQEELYNSLLKSKNDVQLAVVYKEDDSLIGIIGIHKIDWVHRLGDISVVIGEQSRTGKGIATEAIGLIIKHAFLTMNLRRLTAGMAASNIGAKRCFEKNGFELEGTRRKHIFLNGSYIDIYMMGLLREEWEQQQHK